MISESECLDYLRIAKKAVLKTKALLSKSDRRIAVDSEIGRDIKLRADKESEKIILDYLEEQSSFSILSEEIGFLEGDDKSLTWVVDPLDGSLNYVRGIPLSCASVGLWQGNKPILGVVYDFNRSELFEGIAGKESWLNGENISNSFVNKKEKAVLCTGFPVNTDFTVEGLSDFVQKIQNYKKIRLLGSAALSLAYVAAGRADAYMENDIMIWDVAAGIAIASGSGCKCSFKEGSRTNSLRVRVSNGNINLDD